MKYDIRDISLSEEGKKRILWADNNMQVLRQIRERFEKEKPLKGRKIAACLHVTSETANLMRTLKAGGAEVFLCASNPLSTQDDVAASLVKDFEVPVFAINGEDNETYYKHIDSVLTEKPDITQDDGCDLVSTVHKKYPEIADTIIGGTEETTTGVIRLHSMNKDKELKYPVIAVNDAKTKHFFDNRYGTGQSTLDGIIRATNVLIAGLTVVVAGYGWCGRGFAMRARGLGANVVVTEIDPTKALEALMDGFRVMTMEKAAEIGDIFCTITGNMHVIRDIHWKKLKDGAIVCNSGHFDVELDLKSLEEMTESKKNVRKFVTEHTLKDGRRINVLAEGRLINLGAAEGHPGQVMDMSFANQALSAEWFIKKAGSNEKVEVDVFPVPEELDNWIAKIKLETMNTEIDVLTAEQEKYLNSWKVGT